MFLRIDLISPCNSSTLPCFSCWHTLSISDTYLLIGGSLVTTAKLGPWVKNLSCASVRGVLERLWTHLTLLWFDVASDVASNVTSEVVVVSSDVVFSDVPIDW